MRQLLYVSSTSLETSNQVLEDILASSRKNNSRDGITGVLLHIQGGFMQILEGDAPAVTHTYERICKDKRHWKTFILLDRNAPRSFSDWSMGFARVAKENDPACIFELTEDALKGRLRPEAPTEIVTLLQTFYRINAR